MNNKNWMERFAQRAHELIGKWGIPFTTPFFAVYNCYKLMKGVENEYLRALIFIISMFYVLMSLCLAIYLVFTTPN